jgi:hypothetical protein
LSRKVEEAEEEERGDSKCFHSCAVYGLPRG